MDRYQKDGILFFHLFVQLFYIKSASEKSLRFCLAFVLLLSTWTFSCFRFHHFNDYDKLSLHSIFVHPKSNCFIREVYSWMFRYWFEHFSISQSRYCCELTTWVYFDVVVNTLIWPFSYPNYLPSQGWNTTLSLEENSSWTVNMVMNTKQGCHCSLRLCCVSVLFHRPTSSTWTSIKFRKWPNGVKRFVNKMFWWGFRASSIVLEARRTSAWFFLANCCTISWRLNTNKSQA